MRRHCDGTDPYLLRYNRSCPHPVEHTLIRCAEVIDGGIRPCDCGKVFDDVNHSVIYPHQEV